MCRANLLQGVGGVVLPWGCRDSPKLVDDDLTRAAL
jgi:hypothetical protein